MVSLSLSTNTAKTRHSFLKGEIFLLWQNHYHTFTVIMWNNWFGHNTNMCYGEKRSPAQKRNIICFRVTAFIHASAFLVEDCSVFEIERFIGTCQQQTLSVWLQKIYFWSISWEFIFRDLNCFLKMFSHFKVANNKGNEFITLIQIYSHSIIN